MTTRATLRPALALSFVPLGLLAQAPTRGADIPIVPTALRDTASEARMFPPGSAQPRYFRVFTIDATIEVVFRWYAEHLNASPTQNMTGQPEDTVDTVPKLESGGVSPIKPRTVFHSFEDECVDPPQQAGAPGAAAPCKKWRRGKDKRGAIDLVRVGYTRGRWLERGLFTWYVGSGTDVVRFRVELLDTGLAPNWKYYTPRTQFVIKTEVVAPSSP